MIFTIMVKSKNDLICSSFFVNDSETVGKEDLFEKAHHPLAHLRLWPSFDLVRNAGKIEKRGEVHGN